MSLLDELVKYKDSHINSDELISAIAKYMSDNNLDIYKSDDVLLIHLEKMDKTKRIIGYITNREYIFVYYIYICSFRSYYSGSYTMICYYSKRTIEQMELLAFDPSSTYNSIRNIGIEVEDTDITFGSLLPSNVKSAR